ncbi:hypothetical protein EK21DRAFT_112834 [Setomelanomma holmii]|uniref:Uncharacterized protein n=1 Tax=Setomelanomma holmii TaxID=210430 RepID=A0A9P4LLQ9_9PLEO|nr:hypothetical protein EK21DRAFT_112834 [Setomelanomma holmii]
MALHSVFLAGLTLIYCTWLSPKDVFGIKTSNDMNACSIVLYIITERWPAAKKYRDVFENVKQTVLDRIEENGYEERKAIESLKMSLPATLGASEKDEDGRLYFKAMTADMAGEGLRQPEQATSILQSVTFKPLSFLSAMNASTMDCPTTGLGLGTGLSPDACSNQWMLELDAGNRVEGYADTIGNVQFPLE